MQTQLPNRDQSAAAVGLLFLSSNSLPLHSMLEATNEHMYPHIVQLLAYTGAGGKGASRDKDRNTSGQNRKRSEIGPALQYYPWRAVSKEQGPDIKSKGICKDCKFETPAFGRTHA